mmetsp:Transcript_29766/g.78870  ORF Transcript_29766/g.78870 Transcript_29766/m.78870 type:complete len:254 (+) Transcript_29766:413-1174(+)
MEMRLCIRSSSCRKTSRFCISLHMTEAGASKKPVTEAWMGYRYVGSTPNTSPHRFRFSFMAWRKADPTVGWRFTRKVNVSSVFPTRPLGWGSDARLWLREPEPTGCSFETLALGSCEDAGPRLSRFSLPSGGDIVEPEPSSAPSPASSSSSPLSWMVGMAARPNSYESGDVCRHATSPGFCSSYSVAAARSETLTFSVTWYFSVSRSRSYILWSRFRFSTRAPISMPRPSSRQTEPELTRSCMWSVAYCDRTG